MRLVRQRVPARGPATSGRSRSAAGARPAARAPGSTAERMLALQPTHGNRYVQRLLQREAPKEAGAEKAAEEAKAALEPAKLKSGLLKLDLDLKPPPPAFLAPPKPGEAVAGEKQPPWKPAAGPKEPRAATSADLAKAIAAIPAVESASARLQRLVLEKIKGDYGRLSTSGKVALISTAAVFAGAALTGVIADPRARKFALKQLNGKNLPLPGIPVHVRFMTGAREKGVMFTVDIAALLRK